jgi:hypothetical protein
VVKVLILTMIVTIIGVFLSLLLCIDTKGWKKISGFCVTIALLASLCVIMSTMETRENRQKWNDGACYNCGSSWELVNAQHKQNGGNYYFYACKNCGTIIELTQNFS